MNHWEQIYEVASDNYGIITAAEASLFCNSEIEMPRWVKIGRLIRCWRGVYKLSHYIPTQYDIYAEAVAIVGEGAFLCGDAVLSINDLALVNPSAISVATSRRISRKLPPWIRLVKLPHDHPTVSHFGIPGESIPDAIRSCIGKVPPSRLLDAIAAAEKSGLILPPVVAALRKDLS